MAVGEYQQYSGFERIKVEIESITPSQCRAARALVNVSQTQLAEAASVSRSTIADLESERRKTTDTNNKAIMRAISAYGVELVDGGVKLRKFEHTTLEYVYDEKRRTFFSVTKRGGKIIKISPRPEFRAIGGTNG